MAYCTDTELLKNIRQGSLQRVFMLYGKETFLLEGYLKLLTEKAVPGSMQSFNLQRLDGQKCQLDELEDAVETLPMLAERKCVVVTDFNIEKLTVADNKRLKKLLLDPPQSTVLVFAFVHLEILLKKSAKWKAFAKQIDAVGDVVAFDNKSQTELIKILTKRAQKQGAAIERPVCVSLIERCGTGLDLLIGEMDKLISYAGQGEITQNDVLQLTASTMDSTAFDLARSILQSRYDRAFAILNELFGQRQEEIAILGALSMSFIDLYRAKCALSAGQNADALLQVFAYRGKEFRIRNAMRDAAKFSLEQIKTCVDILYETDCKLKSSRVSNRVLLEQTVAQMLMAKTQAQNR